jgi:hypothetical protein
LPGINSSAILARMRGHTPSRETAPIEAAEVTSRPIPTLGQLAAQTSWVWVHCEARDCHHRSPLKLAEPIARYGEDMTSDVLRLKTRCSNCGTRGATLRLPSWVDSTTGHAPFPD